MTPRDDRFEWITIKEYARELDVSEKTVRRWIQRGKVMGLQHEKRGHWRIRVVKSKAS